GEAAGRLADRLEEVTVVVALDEVRDDLGVGPRAEAVAVLGELAPELGVVLDDPVVDDRDPFRAVDVGVGVDLGRASVGRPPRVRDPDVAGERALGDRRLEGRDLADRLAQLDPAAVERGDSRGVVAAVFEAPERRDEDGQGHATTGVTDDPAHGWNLRTAPR